MRESLYGLALKMPSVHTQSVPHCSVSLGSGESDSLWASSEETVHVRADVQNKVTKTGLVLENQVCQRLRKVLR